jgi:hypothetical protein
MFPDGRLLYFGDAAWDASATPSVFAGEYSGDLTESRPDRLCVDTVVTLEV